MSGLKQLVKKIPVVKNYRVKRWKQYSRRMMFSVEEVKQLEQEPHKIQRALREHIKNSPDISDDIEKNWITSCRNHIYQAQTELQMT